MIEIHSNAGNKIGKDIEDWKIIFDQMFSLLKCEKISF